ncbi:creatininase family protein [Planctomicrobium sp. SH664]|uniref:creatininase family protein n=1 Tax=Planctomicrobium sp. SH664 TaxID=3448125 RepID=UPI003F5B33D9
MSTSRNPLLLEELTRTAAREAAPRTLLVWPVGAIEQHGPHLPVGTDTFTIEHLARQAAARAAESIPVFVAPTLPFGSSHHHLPFGGTMSLGTEAFYRTTYDLAESLVTSGFRKIFILNGHGGNHELLQLVARDLARVHPVSVAAASYWTVAWEALVALDAHVDSRLPGHAGAFETSVMLALRPELVRDPRPHRVILPSTDPRGFAQSYRAEHHGCWDKTDGYSDSPDRGTTERGRQYLNATINALARAMIEFDGQAVR